MQKNTQNMSKIIHENYLFYLIKGIIENTKICVNVHVL